MIDWNAPSVKTAASHPTIDGQGTTGQRKNARSDCDHATVKVNNYCEPGACAWPQTAGGVRAKQLARSPPF